MEVFCFFTFGLPISVENSKRCVLFLVFDVLQYLVRPKADHYGEVFGFPRKTFGSTTIGA